MDYDSVFGSTSKIENRAQGEDGEIAMREINNDSTSDNPEEISKKLIRFLFFPLLICMSEQRKDMIINWFDQIKPASYFKPLLFSLVATLIFQPLAEKNQNAFFMIAIFYLFILLSGLLFTAKTHPKLMYILLPTFLISLAIFVSFSFGPDKDQIHNLQIIITFINTGFLTIVAAITSEILLESKQVTKNELYASVAIYLLIGYIFAFLYFTSEMISPGQIIIEGKSIFKHSSVTDYSSMKYAPLSPFFYFSFTTITSVGYGDVLPYSPWARTLTNLEAVCGMFYLALLVSKLINRSTEH